MGNDTTKIKAIGSIGNLELAIIFEEDVEVPHVVIQGKAFDPCFSTLDGTWYRHMVDLKCV